MTDLATLRKLSTPRLRVMPCAVAMAFELLDGETVAVLKEGLAEDPDEAVLAGRKPITNAGIARAINSLVAGDARVSWQAVRSHRMKICSCYAREERNA